MLRQTEKSYGGEAYLLYDKILTAEELNKEGEFRFSREGNLLRRVPDPSHLCAAGFLMLEKYASL
ncbi:hypothetical protein [Mogibacterium timidum]|uniref:hypothetical protein n=1 Tax=Mogibacterium timidum TaxID=35519 RepID=UPI0028D8F8B5|nr:hypothetical protein [Mogibacterium timidum]